LVVNPEEEKSRRKPVYRGSILKWIWNKWGVIYVGLKWLRINANVNMLWRGRDFRFT
jgi:hypothetical protein